MGGLTMNTPDGTRGPEKNTERRCTVCNRNYKEDGTVVLDNLKCTRCTLKKVQKDINKIRKDPWEF